MAISGITKAQYDSFLQNGGTLIIEIDAEDICWEKKFEEFEYIKPNLSSGFEIPPINLTQSSELLAHIFSKPSHEFDRLLAIVYLSRGKVIYKKLPNGKFQAECTFQK